jgi:DNA polymerase-1
MKTLATTWAGKPYTLYYFEQWEELRPYVGLIKSYELLGVDIETSKKAKHVQHKSAGLCPHLSDIRLLQLYGGDDKVFIFDCSTIEFKKFIPLLQSKKLIAHNALFEHKHFTHNGCSDINIHCTMVMYALIMKARLPEYTDIRFGLDAMCLDLYGVRIDKNLQVSNWNGTISLEQIRYAAIDAIAAFKAAQDLKPFLEKYKLVKVYQMMKDLIPVVSEMERSGIKVDVERHNKLIAGYEKEQKDLEESMCHHFGSSNPASAKQFDAWVKVNVPAKKRSNWTTTKSGYYSGDSKTLSEHQDIEAIRILSEWKGSFKSLNTYGKGLQKEIHPVTGRIHSNFNMLKTRTGRLSSSNPNAQNYPRDKEFRKIFVAEPGNVLIVSDFSQIETRVAGIVSGDPVINKAYEDGEDLYKVYASKLYGVTIEEVTKEQRQHAKTAILGFAYGMSAPKLQTYAQASGLTLSLQTCEKLFKGYHTIYRVYSQWCTKVRDFYTPKGFCRTKLGRVRILDKFEGKFNGYTVIPNTIIQGSSAEVMYCAMIDLHKKKVPAKILLSVHDEMVLECKEEHADNVCKELEASMVMGLLTVYPGSCTRGLADAFKGNNWAEAKH